MATLKTISAALKLIDSKKENLKKAFDELQSHSSLLSSFSLTWSDRDSHFTTLHDSLTQRFHLLESLESSQPNPITDPYLTSSKRQNHLKGLSIFIKNADPDSQNPG
ncbi:FRIGIDA-like protein 1 [Fagus crenata]